MVKPRRKRPSAAEAQELLASIDLESGAGFLFRVASARANALFEELTGQTETTPQQYGTLLILHQRGVQTPSQLAIATHADRSTLGEIVRRLVNRDLVSLTPNGADGRSKKVMITAAGESALQLLGHGAPLVQTTLLSCVPSKHRSLFMRYLTLISLGTTAKQRPRVLRKR